MTGIKIGDSNDSSNVSFVTVERNICYENEDPGIDLKGAKRVLVRGNLAYRNGDHGYDNNVTKHTTFQGNIAARNNHDGMSVEATSRNVEVYNCIFAENAIYPNSLAFPGGIRELAILDTTGFKSDFNVIVGLPAMDWVIGGQNYYRRLVEFPIPAPGEKRTWNTVAGYVDSTTALDQHSKSQAAAFIDSGAGVFRPRWKSQAVEGADTTKVGWLTTDLSGVARHDCSGKTTSGSPGNAYGDIGAYEYDDGMAPINVGFGYNQIYVSWNALGRYGNTDWKPAWFEVWVDGVLKLHKDNPSEWPGFVDEFVSVSSCASHSVQVRTKDEYADTAFTNIVAGETCCMPGCFDRPELSAGTARDEGVDLPLSVEWAGENPSRGQGIVGWSIPRAHAGAPYELSLFDVAGRRVSSIARGTSRAGRFTAAVPFRARSGGALPNGLFFLRLRVGGEVLNRTIVLAR